MHTPGARKSLFFIYLFGNNSRRPHNLTVKIEFIIITLKFFQGLNIYISIDVYRVITIIMHNKC